MMKEHGDSPSAGTCLPKLSMSKFQKELGRWVSEHKIGIIRVLRGGGG
jgi:hypothetical protein